MKKILILIIVLNCSCKIEVPLPIIVENVSFSITPDGNILLKSSYNNPNTEKIEYMGFYVFYNNIEIIDHQKDINIVVGSRFTSLSNDNFYYILDKSKVGKSFKVLSFVNIKGCHISSKILTINL